MSDHDYDQKGIAEAFNSGVDAVVIWLTEHATSDTEKVVFGPIIAQISALQKPVPE